MKSLTIIFPIHPLEKEIQKRISDLESFFAKWPLVTDLLFVLEPGCDEIRRLLEGVKHEKINSHFIQNSSWMGRAASLQKGLAQAQGELVILGSFDLSIPMAEYFNLIHEAIAVPDISVFKGNRFTSRKKQSGQRRYWHRVLEDIILEKWRSGILFKGWVAAKAARESEVQIEQIAPTEQEKTFKALSQKIAAVEVQDPLCGLYALRQMRVEELRGERPLKQWYYSLDLLKWIASRNLKLVEIPVVNKVDENSKIKLWREFLRFGF